jgi:hypothetical protein
MKERTGIMRLFLATAMLSYGAFAHAGEAEFLKSMDGSWTGEGTARIRVNSFPMSVSCKFSSDSTESSLSLQGRCTGFLGFSRAIGAVIKSNGTTYRGSYVGAGTGTAGLSGKRSDNSLELTIRWAKMVNGDRSAKMTIEKVGSNGMRLITVDNDPKTGKSVVTSEITLRRAF